MKKPYRICLIIAFLVSVLLLMLQPAYGLDQPLTLIMFGGLFFVVTGLAITLFYHSYTRMDRSYRQVVTGSLILTYSLFLLDYTILDKDPPNPPAKQIIFESIFIGSLYALAFTLVGWLMIFAFRKFRGFSRKTTG